MNAERKRTRTHNKDHLRPSPFKVMARKKRKHAASKETKVHFAGRTILIGLLAYVYLAYLYKAYDKLYRDQVATTVRHQRRSWFKLPTVTVCGFTDWDPVSGNISGPHEAVDAGLKEYGGFFVVGGLHVHGGEGQELNTTLISPNSTDADWDEFNIVNEYGNHYCNSYTPPAEWWTPALEGTIHTFTLWLRRDWLSSIMPAMYVYLTDPRESAMAAGLKNAAMTFLPTHLRDEGSTEVVGVALGAIILGEKVSLPRKEYPCVVGGTKGGEPSYTHCLWNYLRHEHTCVGEKASTHNCDFLESYRATAAMRSLLDMDARQVRDLTGCRPSCMRNTYELRIAGDMPIRKRMYLERQRSIGNAQVADLIEIVDTWMSFFIRDASYSVEEEYLVYDPASFADCARMGGILLGVSFLAAYDRACGLLPDLWKTFWPSVKKAELLK